MIKKISSLKEAKNGVMRERIKKSTTRINNKNKFNPNKRKQKKGKTYINKKSNFQKSKRIMKKHKSCNIININIKNDNNIDKIILKTSKEKLLNNNRNIDFKNNKMKIKIFSNKSSDTNTNFCVINKDIEKESLQKEDINELTYNQAIIYDKRNIFQIFGSLIIVKLELINIFCGNEKFKIILICEYILSLLLNFFFNTLLYSDDVISDNYHNNGELDYFVSLVLSLLSNIITSIILYYIKFSKGIDERIELILELKSKNDYIRNLIIYNKYLRLKFICFFIGEIFIVSGSFYYIVIFCIVYNSSKVNIIINYLISLVESLITALLISIIILITRKIGLCYKNKYLYNTSKYINDKF
jgi:hypothetical protein